MGIQESLQTKLDRFLQTLRATHNALGKSPRELLMNRQPKLRFSVLRAKSLKQYYVKRRSVRKNPKPFLVLLSLKQSILANVIYNNQVFTSTKLRLSTASFSPHSAKRTSLQHPSQHLQPLTLLYQTESSYP